MCSGTLIDLPTRDSGSSSRTCRTCMHVRKLEVSSTHSAWSHCQWHRSTREDGAWLPGLGSYQCAHGRGPARGPHRDAGGYSLNDRFVSTGITHRGAQGGGGHTSRTRIGPGPGGRRRGARCGRPEAAAATVTWFLPGCTGSGISHGDPGGGGAHCLVSRARYRYWAWMCTMW